MARFYAGIGSRETPKDILATMEKIGKYMAYAGLTLRSGGAGGADSAFERGCGNGPKVIYLPWKGFNGSDARFIPLSKESFAMAQAYHPAWDRLSQGATCMMARNCYQVLGDDLQTPVEFIVCWTKDGGSTGGTGQALRLAMKMNIPIYNLFFPQALIDLRKRFGL